MVATQLAVKLVLPILTKWTRCSNCNEYIHSHAQPIIKTKLAQNKRKCNDQRENERYWVETKTPRIYI